MQKKKGVYHNLRLKMFVTLCAIILLSQGLFMQPVKAHEASAANESASKTDIPIDGELSVVTWSNPKWVGVFTVKDSDGTVWFNSLANGSPWSGWSSLGKPTNYALTSVEAVSWSPNRVDIFASSYYSPQGLGDNIWHNWWNGPGTSWGGWENLGAGYWTSNVQAISWGPGHMDIFSDNLIGAPPNTPVVHKGYNNGVGWAPSQLGWEALESGQPDGSYNAVSWGANRIDLFKRSNSDNKIYWKYWNGSAWKPSLAGWNYMNGQGLDTPYAVSWSANRLDVFVRGTDGAIWANGSPDGGASWYGWYSLAGGPSDRTPTAVAWGPNRLDVFENIAPNGYNGNIYHKWWNGSAWGPAQTGAGEWLGPVSFGNPPKVVSWGVDHLDLFGRSSSGNVYHKAWNVGWTPPAGSAWEDLGAP